MINEYVIGEIGSDLYSETYATSICETVVWDSLVDRIVDMHKWPMEISTTKELFWYYLHHRFKTEHVARSKPVAGHRKTYFNRRMMFSKSGYLPRRVRHRM